MTVTMQSESTFWRVLRETREAAGLSQSRLAARAGYDHSYVSRLESESRAPTRDAVIALANAMGCDEIETDKLLMSANFLPINPQNMLQEEPGLWDAYNLLRGAVLPDDVKNDLRSVVLMGVRQARRAGTSLEASS